MMEDEPLHIDLEKEKQIMADRMFLEDLLEEEEKKLYSFTDDVDDSFFNGKEYRNLVEECGFNTENILNELDYMENKDTSTAYANFKKLAAKMTDITDGQKLVFKRLISKGEGPKVPIAALVIYNYKFYHEYQPEPFDSTRFKMRPDRQRVGVGQLIPGIDYALQSMCKKERALFVLDYRVMFGEQGVPPRIPQSADIYAEIEVIDYTEKNLIDVFFDKTPEERLEMSFDELMAIAQQCRDDANVAVRAKRYAVALTKYARGLDILYAVPIADDEKEEIRQNQVSMYHLNMAFCYLQLGRDQSAVNACDIVLNKDPSNQKALYRKGRGLMNIGRHEDAASCLRRANAFDPTNREILKAIAENEEFKRRNTDTYKQLAKAMLNMNTDDNDNHIDSQRQQPNLESDFAKQLRSQLLDFIAMDDRHFLQKIKGCSKEETEVFKALCAELGLECIDKDGIIVRKR